MDTAAAHTASSCLEICPSQVQATLNLIGSKWAVPVLLALHAAPAPRRYAELRRLLRDISPKELAKHLRALEKAGLIGRKVYATVPPRVEYWLTELGATTMPAVRVLAELGERFGAAAATEAGRLHQEE